MHQPFRRAARLAAAPILVVALALTGCAEPIQGVLFPNQRPTVELTNAPVVAERRNPYFYAYKVNWSGNDADGRVDHYLFAVDPSPGDTTWIRSDRNEETVFFRASQPDSIKGTEPRTASDFHTFILKAVDDDGAQSEPRRRDFFSYTIAPTVLIRNPIPNEFLYVQVSPSVRIQWEGSDVDGQFTQKPVRYKYRMFDLDDPDIVALVSTPDSLRDREWANHWAGWDSTSADTTFVQFTNLTPLKSYLFVLIGFDEAGAFSPEFSLRNLERSRNWAGWDSTGAETTFVRFTNLTPKKRYLFVLIGFDEAGAFSPEFSLRSNMLRMTAGFASSLGPRIRIFNQFIDFTYPSGGYTTDPLREIPVEIPSGVPINVCWEAIPTEGSIIQHFRWMVDGNINDECDRVDEVNDYQCWSREDPTMPNCVTLKPFADGEHRFYLECADNNTQRSLGILKMTAVTPTFDKPLIVVDDTRREPDKFLGDTTLQRPDTYTQPWPSSTELDTFLFARGGFPWRGTRNPTSGVTSVPGVFAGYDLELNSRLRLPDTLGTRLGLENAALGVPLSRIGQYRNLVWMVDATGADHRFDDNQLIRPVTALYAMSGPGRASTLAAYTQLGGRVWLLGGGAAFASLRQFDEEANNHKASLTTIFTTSSIQNRPPELGPARIMYDGAHWRSSLAITRGFVRTYRYEYWERTRRTDGTLDSTLHVVKHPWSHVARGELLTRPPYSKLPSELRHRAPETDPLPPTRNSTQGGLYYLPTYPVEYIHSPNFVLEDVDPDPEVVREASVLDTLYEAESIVLLTRRSGLPEGALNRAPQMTYYHGNRARQFVFSGFAPWNYARADCIALVDFVLQDLWGLPRAAVDRGSGGPAFVRGGDSRQAMPAVDAARSAPYRRPPIRHRVSSGRGAAR